MQGDRERCLEAGMSGYLGKPIRFEELVGTISQCVPGEPGLRAAADGSAAPRSAPYAASAPLASRGLASEILDPAAWSRLRAMLGPKAGEMLPKLIDTFLEDAVQVQSDIQRAIAGSNAGELRRAAHTLKSNAANFGATALEAACLDLENAGKNNSLEAAPDLFARIEKEFEQAKTALLAMRAQLPQE
jgi:HPt (histidine-containing phosphotransfer) domain-containing protein